MANKFFDGLKDGRFMDGLGEKISKTAKELSGHAETIYETQKLRNKISNENRAVDKLLSDLGNILYKQYIAGEELEDNQKIICEQIDQHMQNIEKISEDLANMQGKKVCPVCQQKVAKNAAFCPNCGTACPVAEEPVEEDIVDMPVEEEACPECEECAEGCTEEEVIEEAAGCGEAFEEETEE